MLRGARRSSGFVGVGESVVLWSHVCARSVSGRRLEGAGEDAGAEYGLLWEGAQGNEGLLEGLQSVEA